MIRILLLSSAAIVGLLALSDLSEAESQTKTIDGKQLEIRTTCVKTVTIEPQADLTGKIIVEATAKRADELGAITLTSGDAARIERKGRCDNDQEITLVLNIKVPTGMPLDIRETGSGDYTIGAMAGPLKARFAGSGDLKAEEFTSVELEIAGSSDAEFGKINGPTSLSIHGSGDVKIASGTMPSLKVAVAGSGDVQMAAGDIGTLEVQVAGSGDVDLHATAQTASLNTAGSGDIRVAKVTGNVSQHSAGSGEIRIGG
jgi:DUF4097 and DUF4098 domain-containing protein YvlB